MPCAASLALLDIHGVPMALSTLTGPYVDLMEVHLTRHSFDSIGTAGVSEAQCMLVLPQRGIAILDVCVCGWVWVGGGAQDFL